jgi:DNA-binding NtrC family response regulator
VLVEHFRSLAKPGDAAPPFSEETLRSFVAHPWPGNVRELRNAVERLTVLDDVPFSTPTAPESGADADGPTVDIRVPFKDAKNALTDNFERRYVTAMLESTGGNISEAARRAGIDRVYLLRLMGRYGLRKPREG